MLPSEFVQGYERQGVAVAVSDEELFTFSIKIGACLRLQEPLAAGDIMPDLSFCGEDPFYRAHATIINTSIQPDLICSPRFKASYDLLEHCKSADEYFGDWLDGLAAGNLVGGTVITDDDNLVVAVQKAVNYNRFGAPSSLLLRDVAIGEGIRLPAGSIVNAKLPPSSTIKSGQYHDELTVIMNARRVESMCFLRLSGIVLSDAAWVEYLGSKIPRRMSMDLVEANRIASEFVSSQLQRA